MLDTANKEYFLSIETVRAQKPLGTVRVKGARAEEARVTRSESRRVTSVSGAESNLKVSRSPLRSRSGTRAVAAQPAEL